MPVVEVVVVKPQDLKTEEDTGMAFIWETPIKNFNSHREDFSFQKKSEIKESY